MEKLVNEQIFENEILFKQLTFKSYLYIQLGKQMTVK